jgi:hypothetical protein
MQLNRGQALKNIDTKSAIQVQRDSYSDPDDCRMIRPHRSEGRNQMIWNVINPSQSFYDEKSRMNRRKTTMSKSSLQGNNYDSIHSEIVALLKAARSASARSINALMTATYYWTVGRRIVQAEQQGQARAEYGKQLLEQLARDLVNEFGRGFSLPNLWKMRAFYLAWPEKKILSTLSIESPKPLFSNGLALLPTNAAAATVAFPLPWSSYVRLLAVRKTDARAFYETEALRSGWSVRQLNRQIESQFYERIALSKNKAAMLTKAQKAKPGDSMTPEEAIKDPFVLEFL